MSMTREELDQTLDAMWREGRLVWRGVSGMDEFKTRGDATPVEIQASDAELLRRHGIKVAAVN
jgi:hypothetical protein